MKTHRIWLVSAILFALPASSCALGEYVDRRERHEPDPAFGRPALVRGAARAGSWVGGIFGGLAAVALLPVTYPVSLLAREPFGRSREEFLYGPVTMGAGLGHFVLGAPLDAAHYLFWRAWTAEETEVEGGER